jgi:hypothetical protein
MSDRLQKLIDDHPLLQNVQCGVCIGDGWVPLVECLVRQIEHHVKYENDIRARGKKKLLRPAVAQVKEKFGYLRVYVDDGDEFTDGLVVMAEAMSRSICEDCGSAGKLRLSGWMRTLCDGCDDRNSGSRRRQ